jgi:hypothetical protein
MMWRAFRVFGEDTAGIELRPAAYTDYISDMKIITEFISKEVQN